MHFSITMLTTTTGIEIKFCKQTWYNISAWLVINKALNLAPHKHVHVSLNVKVLATGEKNVTSVMCDILSG